MQEGAGGFAGLTSFGPIVKWRPIMINNATVFVLCQMVGDSTTIKGLFTSEERVKSAILEGNWLIVPVKVNQLADVTLSDKAPGALLIE